MNWDNGEYPYIESATAFVCRGCIKKAAMIPWGDEK